MKKRLLILACMLICLFSLAGCGKKEAKKISLTDDEKAAYEKLLTAMINETSAMSKADADAALETLSPKSPNYKMLSGWASNMDDLGKLKSVGAYRYEFDVNEIKIKVDVEYEKHTATYIFFFKKEYVELENIQYINLKDVNLVVNRSMKEKLVNAASNTLMGMGTVFGVLIIIIVFISLLKYVYIIENFMAAHKEKKAARKEKKRLEKELKNKDVSEDIKKEAVDNAIEQITANEAMQDGDDEEIIAVISAAIAAYEAETGGVEGFRVRSIRRTAKRNW